MKKNLLFFIAGLLALGSGFYVQKSVTAAADRQQADALPGFKFPDIQGQSHTISEWRGKVLVINFWATWCPPCRREIPEFIELQKQFASKNLQFIGIAIEDKQPVEEYLDFAKVNYPVLIAGDAGIELSWRLGNTANTVPFTVIVDQQGRIRHRHSGIFSRQQVLEQIKPLL